MDDNSTLKDALLCSVSGYARSYVEAVKQAAMQAKKESEKADSDDGDQLAFIKALENIRNEERNIDFAIRIITQNGHKTGHELWSAVKDLICSLKIACNIHCVLAKKYAIRPPEGIDHHKLDLTIDSLLSRNLRQTCHEQFQPESHEARMLRLDRYSDLPGVENLKVAIEALYQLLKK